MYTFINQAKIGQNKWWQYVVTLLILFTVIPLSLLLIKNFVLPALLEIDYQESSNFNQIVRYVGTVIIGLLGILILFYTIVRLHKRPFYSLNYAKYFSLRELFEGIIISAILITISYAVFDFGSFKNFNFDLINYKLLNIIPLAFICIAIQSYFEELLFRGYLLQSLALKIKNKWLLFVLIGVLFSVIHVGADIQSLLEIFFAGFTLSFIVFKRESLFFATGIHLIYNFYSLYLVSVFNQEQSETTVDTVIEWNSFLATTLSLILVVSYIVLKEKLFTTKNKRH